MRWHYVPSPKLKDRAGNAAVVLFLIAVFLATGCDAPGRASRGERAREPASTAPTVTPVSYVTETPVPVEPERSTVPTTVTFEEADSAFRERRYEDAAVLFGVYTGNRPENPWGHYMHALSEWRAGYASEAITSFERALALDPSHVKSRLNLGRVLLRTDRPGEALEQIKRALEFDPGSGEGFRLLGIARSDLGRVEEAIVAYGQAILLDERDAWSMNNLGLLFIREGWFQEALPPLARATELRQDVATFYNNLGLALERSGYVTAAADAYRRALELDGLYAKADVNLARVEVLSDDPSLGPVDLAELARRFVSEIHGEPEGEPEPVPLDTVPAEVPVVVGDSTMARDLVSDSLVPLDTLTPVVDTTTVRDTTPRDNQNR